MFTWLQHKLKTTPTVTIDDDGYILGTSYECSCGNARGWIQSRDTSSIKRIHKLHKKQAR